jgi:hypothetical protein
LLRKAQSKGKHKTKTDNVTEALKDYIGKRNQVAALNLFGRVDYDDDYDYK